MESIFKIYVRQTRRDDRKIWPYFKRGELSSKLAYITIHEEGRDSTNSPVDGKALWQSFLKECSYLVEAALIMQFTYINLFPKKKISPMMPICLICTDIEEFTEHPLFLCDHVRAAWFGSDLGMLMTCIAPLTGRDWWTTFMHHQSTFRPSSGPSLFGIPCGKAKMILYLGE